MHDCSIGDSMPLKVLCLHGVTFGGGVTRLVRDGMPELAKLPGVQIKVADLYARSDMIDPNIFEVDITVGVPGRGYISKAKGGFKRYVSLFLQSGIHARIVIRLAKALKRYNVIYMHSYKELVLASLAKLLSRSSVALVWHCHGLGEGAPPRLLTTLANRCQRILADSNSARDRLILLSISSQRIATVLNAVKIQANKEAMNLTLQEISQVSSGKIVILVAPAIINFEKGIHLVIEALVALPHTCELWITGNDANGVNSAYVSELRAMVNRLGISGQVHFIGFQSEIYGVMKYADIVCMPSLCPEGFGLVAAEGMALGKIVIVSNRGGLPEVVDRGRYGMIFDPEVPGDLAEKLKLALAEPARMSALTEEAAAYAANAYSYARWAEEVRKELYTALQSGQLYHSS